MDTYVPIHSVSPSLVEKKKDSLNLMGKLHYNINSKSWQSYDWVVDFDHTAKSFWTYLKKKKLE